MASKLADLAAQALMASRSGADTGSDVSSIISRVLPSLSTMSQLSHNPALPTSSLMNRLSQANAAFQSQPESIDAEPVYDDYIAAVAPAAAVATGETSFSTWLLVADIIFLLIGIILIMASQSKCQLDPNSDSCKSHRSWGIAFTTICSVLMLVILFFKFQ